MFSSIYLVVMLLGEGPTIGLSVNPQQCLAPCEIKTSITITGYEATREVCLALYDGASAEITEEPSRRSCWPFSGRKVTAISIAGIGAGTYRVVASLGAASSSRAIRPLVVVEPYGLTPAPPKGQEQYGEVAQMRQSPWPSAICTAESTDHGGLLVPAPSTDQVPAWSEVGGPAIHPSPPFTRVEAPPISCAGPDIILYRWEVITMENRNAENG